VCLSVDLDVVEKRKFSLPLSDIESQFRGHLDRILVAALTDLSLSFLSPKSMILISCWKWGLSVDCGLYSSKGLSVLVLCEQPLRPQSLKLLPLVLCYPIKIIA
jgi:hypothetical protein